MGLMKLVLGLFAAYMYSDLRIAGTSWYWTPLLVLASRKSGVQRIRRLAFTFAKRAPQIAVASAVLQTAAYFVIKRLEQRGTKKNQETDLLMGTPVAGVDKKGRPILAVATSGDTFITMARKPKEVSLKEPLPVGRPHTFKDTDGQMLPYVPTGKNKKIEDKYLSEIGENLRTLAKKGESESKWETYNCRGSKV